MHLILILHNIRSTHNVGSLIRTSEGLGVDTVICTGYTPYPSQQSDTRLPHEHAKVTRQINKTALGAEHTINVQHHHDIDKTIEKLKHDGFQVVALEQAKNSVMLPSFVPSHKVALIVGREVEGIEKDILRQSDTVVEIPMLGQKESYNVAVAAAIALYHCRFTP